MMMKKAGDDDDRDVTLDECGVFFPLLSLHDGTVQPTILSTTNTLTGMIILSQCMHL